MSEVQLLTKMARLEETTPAPAVRGRSIRSVMENNKIEIIIKIVETEKELADARTVRSLVFQKEQGIAAEMDFDGKDDEAKHIIAYFDKKPLGTMRIRYINGGKIAKIERMAVLREFRSQNIGGRMMEYALSYLKGKEIKEATLDAQEYVKKFYEKFGFKQEGETFTEVGIPHVKMSKDLI